MRLNALLSHETLRIGETNFEGSYYSGSEEKKTQPKNDGKNSYLWIITKCYFHEKLFEILKNRFCNNITFYMILFAPIMFLTLDIIKFLVN